MKRPTLVNRDRQHYCAEYRTTDNPTHPVVSHLLGIKRAHDIVNNSYNDRYRPYRQQTVESQKIVSNYFTCVGRHELNSEAAMTQLYMN
ncbi:hypothetical protein T265_02781 [Opisthorchis viverrini]|uniref:Uncharacterized protein n=1 Tax=Opisthorchis viverrini TaxID=6198 RepID=A0A074ZXZ0_OPIVI|nr:hypothetical protein T265_02781 [Opisthorchis viverrini]KER30847.1 hypothetical protein T265_02781 [Opisthorchis viverrini]